MAERLTRRDFLRLATLSATSLAFLPPPPPDGFTPIGLGRVGTSWIGLFKEPSFRSTRIGTPARDTLLTLLSRETADDGPAYNPLWYRVPDGYVHSGYIQQVRWNPQKPVTEIPEHGALFEVTVPYTRSFRSPDPFSNPLYRLYYQSTAWVVACVTGTDGRFWYRLLDDILRVNYYVRAEHLRRITSDEVTRISPDVPLEEKRIEVSIDRQELKAYEGQRLVLRTLISSGLLDEHPLANGVPTATPTGSFRIGVKTPLRHMGDARLTSDLEAYELPGVPWVSFFHESGIAFHGTYWHTNFGHPMSHGCVNMRTEEAKWVYRWASPIIGLDEMIHKGRGTRVTVI